MKIATTKQLAAASVAAARARLPGPLDIDTLRRLDRAGKHVLDALTTVADDAGVRVKALLKVPGSKTPLVATFDLTVADFNALPTAPGA